VKNNCKKAHFNFFLLPQLFLSKKFKSGELNQSVRPALKYSIQMNILSSKFFNSRQIFIPTNQNYFLSIAPPVNASLSTWVTKLFRKFVRIFWYNKWFHILY